VTNDGNLLVSIGEEKSMRIFSLQSKNEIGEIPPHARSILILSKKKILINMIRSI